MRNFPYNMLSRNCGRVKKRLKFPLQTILFVTEGFSSDPAIRDLYPKHTWTEISWIYLAGLSMHAGKYRNPSPTADFKILFISSLLIRGVSVDLYLSAVFDMWMVRKQFMASALKYLHFRVWGGGNTLTFSETNIVAPRVLLCCIYFKYIDYSSNTFFNILFVTSLYLMKKEKLRLIRLWWLSTWAPNPPTRNFP
jgi:hypothetical protein